jgi:hypothetical protein
MNPDREWDDRPQTEDEAEAAMARSELLARRINARLEREGGEGAYERILEEEIERMRRERGEPEPTPEQEAERDEWIAEMNRMAEESLLHPDPELEAELAIEHPLAVRAHEFGIGVRRQIRASRLRPRGASEEHPLHELEFSLMIAGVKLAGALNGRHWPPGVEFCASTIVRLKRARGYFEDAELAIESCREMAGSRRLGLDEVAADVAAMKQETGALIEELRERLKRGFD